MNSSFTLKHNSGHLELILGCMFSGKSTELIQRIYKHHCIGNTVCVITYSKDNRYGENAVRSHDRLSYKANVCEKLYDFYNNNKSIIEESQVICIEEGQFFSDLFDFVVYCTDELNKHVIVSGLDGDYNRKPFENVINLISHSESVTKLSALCSFCKDGTKANYSMRTVDSEKRELIGGVDTYLPVCRYHFLKNKEEKEIKNNLSQDVFEKEKNF